MDDNWKTKALIIGTVVGAFAGAVSALLLIKRAEKEESPPRLTPGEGIQVGLGVLGLMRMIAGLGID